MLTKNQAKQGIRSFVGAWCELNDCSEYDDAAVYSCYAKLNKERPDLLKFRTRGQDLMQIVPPWIAERMREITRI